MNQQQRFEQKFRELSNEQNAFNQLPDRRVFGVSPTDVEPPKRRFAPKSEQSNVTDLPDSNVITYSELNAAPYSTYPNENMKKPKSNSKSLLLLSFAIATSIVTLGFLCAYLYLSIDDGKTIKALPIVYGGIATVFAVATTGLAIAALSLIPTKSN